MRCYRVHEHGEPLQQVDLPMPTPTGTQVLIKVHAAGLCHTDLHLWDGYYQLGQGKRLSLAERGVKPPLTLSHEISGEVVGYGEQVSDVVIGTHALLHPWIGCGECRYCQHEQENLCLKPQQLGIVKPGGFAEYILVPHPRYLVDLQGLDPAQAAPLACAGLTTFSALNKFADRIHREPVVIIGAGGLGLMALSLLKAQAAKGAIVVDIDDAKLQTAQDLGAIATINSQHADATQQLNTLTEGGAGLILDLVGSQNSLEFAIKHAARGAQIVVCGLMGGEIHLPIPTIVMRPMTIQGSYVGTVQELRALLNLVREGNLEMIPIQTRPIEDVNQAFLDLQQGKVTGRVVLLHAS